jgi:hypothetical protein
VSSCAGLLSQALFENLEGGATIDEFLKWFPGVTRNRSTPCWSTLRRGRSPSPHAQHFIITQQLKVRFGQSENGDRFAERVKNLDGVAGLAARPWRGVMLDNRGDITPSDSFAGDIRGERHTTEEREFHASGYSVINLVRPVAFSSIQTESTRSIRPLGPVRFPRMTNFSP